MALRFKMKDIGNEMFRDGNITLNWLEYMDDGDDLEDQVLKKSGNTAA